MLEFIDGFPDIENCALHNILDLCSPERITLWFYRNSVDLASIENAHVFLLGARIDRINVKLTPFFPRLERYSEHKVAVHSADTKRLELIFEEGEMSFFYETAVHFWRVDPMGRIAAEQSE